MTTPPRRVDHAHVWATRPRPAAVEGASPAPAAAPASASDVGSALVLLNFPVRPDFVQQLWAAADVVVAADGACRKLYDSLSPPARERFLPAAIVGDMDSLDDEARAFYAARGVPVVQVEDQDTTDLFKCLEYLRAKQAETPVSSEMKTRGVRPQWRRAKLPPCPSCSLSTLSSAPYLTTFFHSSGDGLRGDCPWCLWWPLRPRDGLP